MIMERTLLYGVVLCQHQSSLIKSRKGRTPSYSVGWWENSSYQILSIGSQRLNCSEYCNEKERKKKKPLWSPKFDSKTSVKKMTTHLDLTGSQYLKTDKWVLCSVSHPCMLLYSASHPCILLFFSCSKKNHSLCWANELNVNNITFC